MLIEVIQYQLTAEQDVDKQQLQSEIFTLDLDQPDLVASLNASQFARVYLLKNLDFKYIHDL